MSQQAASCAACTITTAAIVSLPSLSTCSLPHDFCSLPWANPSDSPHINRRLRSSSTHNLGKPAQLRRPWPQPRRSSGSCYARETSRRISTSRIIWQAESPSCAIAQSGLLGILKSRCLARGAGGLLLGLLGGVGRHIH